MRCTIKDQHGVSLIAAVFIIVILAFMGMMFISMVTTSSVTATNDLLSAQALDVAEGGIEFALYQFKSGTVCTALANSNVSLGRGSFTVTSTLYSPAATVLTANITATSATIPATSTAGYAPQGRITIESEAIWYGGISGNNFVNVQRGAGGTTAATHAVSSSVSQSQCNILSTGNVGTAQRTAAASVQGTPPSPSSSATSFDGPLTLVSTATTSIASLATTLAAGNNLIIAMVTFQNGTNTAADINAGNLQLRYDTTVLDSTKSLIRVTGPSTNAGTLYDTDNIFAQKTHFFLYRHTGAPASPTYNLVAQATASNRIYAKVKMVVLNNVPYSYSSNDGDGNIQLTTNAGGAVLASHATGLPAGNNIVLAAVQLDQTTTNSRTIDAGDLILRKGGGTGTSLSYNAFDIDLESRDNAKRGTGYLLIATDGGAANQAYTVTGRASRMNSINGAVSIMVLQGLSFSYLSTGTADLSATATTLGSLSTTFDAGNNVVISATQTMNYDWYNRNILTDRLVYGGGGVTPSSNVVPIYLQGSITNDDYASGLLLYHSNAPANPTYSWQSQSDSATGLEPIRADTDMVAVHLSNNSSISIFSRQ